MPFAAGGTLAAGVPVLLSDGLRDAPRWTPGRENVAGTSEYVKDDGCRVSATVRGYARLFSTSASSVYLTASCPDAATLAAARIDVEAWIAVVPPSG